MRAALERRLKGDYNHQAQTGESMVYLASKAAEMPANRARRELIQELTKGWAETNVHAAREWARQLPTGDTRDTALKNFVESIAYWAPNKAAGTVELIGDPTKREESMQITMRSWSEIDPVFAQNWLASLNVPEELKARLRSALPAD